MKLIAQHSDGISTHLLQWTLIAEDGTGTVNAYWYVGASRKNTTFQTTFANARIAQVAELIRGLNSRYHGTTDDAPDYRLEVSTESEHLQTHVYGTLEWDGDVKSDLERFRKAWAPIAAEIELTLALPGRTCQ